MLDSFSQEIYYNCIHFLEQTAQQRLLLLKEIGLARYANFLTKMPFNEANINCVMRFLREPSRVKFPNLRGADLSGLVLEQVNFIRGDLSEANLSGSSLVNADLIFGNFTKADLTNADLRAATLNETIWCGALVKQCQFGTGIGLTNKQRQYLQFNGAVFSDYDD